MMNKYLSIFAALLLMAGWQTVCAQTNYNMTVWKGGEARESLVTDMDSVTFKPVCGRLVTSITLSKTEMEVLRTLRKGKLTKNTLAHAVQRHI